jgi:hypothetical protein
MCYKYIKSVGRWMKRWFFSPFKGDMSVNREQ